MRLDKYLTTLGIGSRTQVKELIKKGKITVNGEKILKPDIHIDENNDEVDLNGVTCSPTSANAGTASTSRR